MSRALADPTVRELVREAYVPVRAHGHGDGELVGRLGAERLGDLLVLDAHERVLARLRWWPDRAERLDWLREQVRAHARRSFDPDDPALARHAATAGPLTRELEEELAALAELLDDASPGRREDAARRLRDAGSRAYRFLRGYEAPSPEARRSVADLLEEMEGPERYVREHGLHHRVDFLLRSAAQEPRAKERLAAILPAEARADPAAWWARHGRAVHFDDARDRYVRD